MTLRAPIAIATFLCLTAGAASNLGQAATIGEQMSDTIVDGRSDFDFMVGKWRVKHRQLKERLAKSTEWIEFEGTLDFRKIMGGLGNTDTGRIDKPDGSYFGATLRTFDPKTQSWRIYWFDTRYPGAPVDPPLVGKFKDGIGEFLADDTFKDRPIKVRFFWFESKDGGPRWEQAFSEDGGKTWETNWIMQYTRDPS